MAQSRSDIETKATISIVLAFVAFLGCFITAYVGLYLGWVARADAQKRGIKGSTASLLANIGFVGNLVLVVLYTGFVLVYGAIALFAIVASSAA